MKNIISACFLLFFSSFCFTQTDDFNNVNFNSPDFLNNYFLEFNSSKNVNSFQFPFQQNTLGNSVLSMDRDLELYALKLNTEMFSNFNLNKNTYATYSNYLRGCDPLDNGITNNLNGGELMLSMIIDNFVNNILFKDKGVFFKK